MITGSQTDIEAKSAAETDDKISVSGHREWLLYILEGTYEPNAGDAALMR